MFLAGIRFKHEIFTFNRIELILGRTDKHIIAEAGTGPLGPATRYPGTAKGAGEGLCF
jgi:hypothetical protein